MSMQKIDMITDLLAFKDSVRTGLILNGDGWSLKLATDEFGDIALYELDDGKQNIIQFVDSIFLGEEEYFSVWEETPWGHVESTIYYNQILSYEYE